MSALLGESIGQLGYVVGNLDEGVEAWRSAQGVGPWLVLRDLQLVCDRAGRTSELVIDVAFSYVGETQIELIEQKNEAPSPYRSMIEGGTHGLHHVAYFEKDDIDALVERAIAQGMQLAFDVRSTVGGRYVYLTMPGTDSVYVELVEWNAGSDAMFVPLLARSRDWDGADAIQEIRL